MSRIGGAALVWPFTGHAQAPARTPRIGVLMSTAEGDSEGQARVATLMQALQALGWTDGRNIRIDLRWGAGDAKQAQVLAAELVGLAPDLILANAGQALKAVQGATRTIPIVFVQVNNPVEGGFVANLAHPGGNITGFTSFEDAMGAKWLQLLREIVPRIARVALVQNAGQTSGTARMLPAIEAAARSMGVHLTTMAVVDGAEIDRAYARFAHEQVGGVIVLPDPLFTVHRDRLIAAAARNRTPTVYYFRFFATSGGLISYGPHTTDIYERAAAYADRILKGAKPGDLPVQQPTRFELVINNKTARAQGLPIPQSLLLRADEVIQ